MLAKRKDLSGKGWSDTKKLGQYRTPEIIDFQYRAANIFIRKYYHSLQMMPLLDAMLTGVSVDSHILDAWLQFFTAIPDYDTPKKPKVQHKPKNALTVAWENGKSVYKVVPI